MLIYILTILVLAFVTESLVEVVIKSEIFRPFRELIFRGGHWFKKLFTCGYCFSFWVASGVVAAVPLVILPLSDIPLVNALLTILIVQRLSNVFHNIIDKGTDKYYDMRYVNSEKD